MKQIINAIKDLLIDETNIEARKTIADYLTQEEINCPEYIIEDIEDIQYNEEKRVKAHLIIESIIEEYNL